jgi:hypothetical protein
LLIVPLCVLSVICDGSREDSIVNALLAEHEFVLEEEADSEDLLVICDATKPACKAAARGRKEWLAEFKGQPVCREMVRTWGRRHVPP